MKSIKYYTRKSHRYLGLFIGIQFLFWAVGGFYFSWMDIDEIHGDHLVNFSGKAPVIQNDLISPDKALDIAKIDKSKVEELILVTVLDENYYRIVIDDTFKLINAKTASIRKPFSKEEAINYAKEIFKPNNEVRSVHYVTKENMPDHLQYRGGPLPAWAISFDHESNSVIYISANKGSFERIRSQNWRIFDFLFMLHILDFDQRDNFNNVLLRGFSILSLITIFSGFLLFYQSSKTIRKIKKKFFNKNKK